MKRWGVLFVGALTLAACTEGSRNSGVVDENPSSAVPNTSAAAKPESTSIDTRQAPSVALAPTAPGEQSATSLPAVVAAPIGGQQFELADGLSILERLPPLAGQVVRVLGPETDANARGFEKAVAQFEQATGAEVMYTGTSDDVSELTSLLEAGTPPDLVIVAQPGRLRELAVAGKALPLPQSIATTVATNFDRFWSDLTEYRGRSYGVPNVASVKSLVWYSPGRFAALGYRVPTTWDEMTTLTARMRADGFNPWCIGVASGEATGWTFTDWLEDIILRQHGPQLYDQWVRHEIGFTDPRIRDSVQEVSRIWFAEGNVFGGRRSIVRTSFSEAGKPLLNGSCLLHRQGSFYESEFRAFGATIGPKGDVDAFYLPTMSDKFGRVVLGSGSMIAPMTDRTATYAALAYFASPEYANARISTGVGGFWSANKLQNTSLYSNPTEAKIALILATASPFRFDGSDLMPAQIGADEFWRGATNYIDGSLTIDDFLDRLDAAWPRTTGS
jgi:alpha-glucoside transport system substrate-binding protein